MPSLDSLVYGSRTLALNGGCDVAETSGNLACIYRVKVAFVT